jgi:hypothetical protein
MPRAVLRNGVIYPIDPLPREWADGKELVVGEAPPDSPEELERWFAELERLCADSDPQDERRLQAALEEATAQAKALVKRQMGLE